jgi:hypothetical protein
VDVVEIQDVLIEYIGGHVVTNAVLGATTIYLDSVDEFDSEDMGQVQIMGEVYDITAVDLVNNTLTISPGLLAAIDVEEDQTRAALYPLHEEKWAMAISEGDDGPGERVRVSHDLHDKLDVGVREVWERETAVIGFDQDDEEVSDSTGELVVLDLLNQTPQTLGGYIRPDTMPPPGTDGSPPGASPTPTLSPLGYSSMVIRWAANVNVDFTKYRVLFDDVTPPVQILGETGGNVMATSALPDGTPLVPGGQYYAAVIAFEDVDGDGPMSAVAGPAGPVAVPADAVSADIMVVNELFSREAYFGTVSIDQLTTGVLDAVMAIVGALEIGGNITIDPTNGIVISTPIGDTRFPTDGTNVEIKGTAVLQALITLGNLAIRGTDNELSKNAELTLEEGVTPPHIGSTITAEYDTYTGHGGFSFRGLTYHATTDRWVRAGSIFGAYLEFLDFDSGTKRYDWTNTSFNLTTTGGRPEVNGAMGGCVVVGDEVYVLCSIDDVWTGTFTGRWYVYQFHYAAGAWTYVRRWRYLTEADTTTLSSKSNYHPAIGYDSVNGELLIAQSENDGDVWVTRYSTVGAYVNGPLRLFEADGTTPFSSRRNTSGIMFTAADVGSNHFWLLQQSSSTVFAFASGRARAATREFKTSATPNTGIAWDTDRFRIATHQIVPGQDPDTGNEYTHHYSKIKDTDLVSNPVNGVQTWRLADAGSPDFAAAETEMSPRTQTAAFPRRAWMRLTSSSDIPNDTGDAGDADSVSFYIARGTGSPARTSYKRTAVPAVGVATVLLDELPTTGDPPPATTAGFSGGTPAIIKSSAVSGDAAPAVYFKGDGTYRLDPDTNDDDTGWTTFDTGTGAAPFATNVETLARYRRIGKQVIVEIEKASNSALNLSGGDGQTGNVGVCAANVIPTSLRPSEVVPGIAHFDETPVGVILNTVGSINFVGGTARNYASGSILRVMFNYFID